MKDDGKPTTKAKGDARIKVQIEDDFQNTALEEVLLVYDDKRLTKAAPHSTDRVELVKTVFNRARDLEREANKVKLARVDPDMSQYDMANKLWKACPYCGAVDINHTSPGNKEYQGCFSCRYLLNEDGTTKRMKS